MRKGLKTKLESTAQAIRALVIELEDFKPGTIQELTVRGILGQFFEDCCGLETSGRFRKIDIAHYDRALCALCRPTQEALIQRSKDIFDQAISDLPNTFGDSQMERLAVSKILSHREELMKALESSMALLFDEDKPDEHNG